jgi:hypothetical protein
MGKVFAPALALGLLFGSTGPLLGQENLKTIIEKAIKVKGREEVTPRSVAVVRHMKGTIHGGEIRQFTGTSYGEKENLKLVIQSQVNGTLETRTLISDGKRTSLTIDSSTIELGNESRQQTRHVDRVAGLKDLLKDKAFLLTALGEATVEGRLAVGIKVAYKDQPDVRLYFDKEQGYLLKTAYLAKEAGMDREVLHEYVLGDYQPFDPGASDRQALLAAKVDVEGPALLEYLRKRTPSKETRDKIQTLVRQLGDRSYKVRTKASADLLAWGTAAAALLREALHDPDPEVAQRAQKCLSKLGSGPENALPAAVVRLIALKRPPGAVEVLLDYLPWAPDEATVREVKSALASTGVRDGKTAAALLQALHSPDPARKAAAAAALGTDGGAFLKQPGRRLLVPGLVLPRRTLIYNDGKKLIEWEVTEVHFFNHLDPSVFARPP